MARKSHQSSDMRIARILSLLPGIFQCLMLQAQPGGLPTEQVEIIKSFDARLADAEKVMVEPAPPAKDTSPVRLDYPMRTTPAGLTYAPPKLRPLALRREAAPEQYTGFVQAGYGFPSSPYFHAGYTYAQADRDARLGVFHHSASSSEIENQRFGRTEIDLDGHYHLPERFTLHGEVGFHQEIASFYGYDQEDTTFTKGAAKQRFNRIHLGGAISNTHANRLGVDYRAEARFYHLKDFYDARENGLDVALSLVKWFAESHPFRIALGNELSAFRDTIGKSLNAFYIKPSFTFHGDAFRARAGLQLVTPGTGFAILPDLEILVSLAGNAMAAYAGWTGNYHQNSFDHLRRYNPFMVSEFQPKTSVYTDLYAGVKGASRGWNYQAQAGFKKIRDLAMFLPDSVDTRRFSVLYDTVGNFYLSGGAGVELWPGMELAFQALQNFYSPENEDRAWHLPGLEVNGSIRYTLLDRKLLLRGDVFIADGIPYRKADGDPGRLGGLLDISASGHYQIIRNLGAWLQINNLTNNQRERWQRYPTFGVNVLGGLMLRF